MIKLKQLLFEGEDKHPALDAFKYLFSAPIDVPEARNIGEWIRFTGNDMRPEYLIFKENW